jgi:hypothetical protein
MNPSRTLLELVRFLVSAALVLTILGGIVLSTLLLLGLADPPVGTRRVSHNTQPTEYVAGVGSETTVLEIPHSDDLNTVEITARFVSVPQRSPDYSSAYFSSWGIHLLDKVGNAYTVWVYTDGYFSFPPFVPNPLPFMHLKPDAPNALYLHFEGDTVTLRLNRELVWRGVIPHLESARVLVSGGESGTSVEITVLDTTYNPQ